MTLREFVHDVVRALHAGPFIVDKISIVDLSTDQKANVATFTVASGPRTVYRFVITKET